MCARFKTVLPSDEMHNIFSTAISDAEVKINEQIAPPGTGKTLSIVRYAVKNRLDIILSFPTHANQETALSYIITTLLELRARRPPLFIVYYEGIENYCILYKPELLIQLFMRNAPNARNITDAIESFITKDELLSQFMKYDFNIIESFYLRILGKFLKQYMREKEAYGEKEALRRYRARIRSVIDRFSQNDICKYMCPVGLYMQLKRKRLYRLFSEPKIILPKRIADKYIEKDIGRIKRFIVSADTDKIVEYSYNSNRDPPICIRFLLISKFSKSPEKTHPVHILAKPIILLTPHAGLEFILETVSLIRDITGINRKPYIFLDEYDSFLLREEKTHLISLEDLDEAINTAKYMAEHERLEHRKKYARYIASVLEEVKQVVLEHLETGQYHPLLNIFYEGAFSSLEDRKLIKAIIPPLSPRVVHIKYFDGTDILGKILFDDKIFREEARKDRLWKNKYRDAKITFTHKLMNRKTIAKIIDSYKTIAHDTESSRTIKVRYLRKGVRPLRDVLKTLTKYLMPLLYMPRYTIYYVYENRDVYFSTIDTRIMEIVLNSERLLLASATPIKWDKYVSGTNLGYPAPSTYIKITEDSLHSSFAVRLKEVNTYDLYSEKKYEMTYFEYSKSYREELIEKLQKHQPIKYEKPVKVTITIRQISPLIESVRNYSDKILFHKMNLPFLPPIKRIRREDLEYVNEVLSQYLRVIYSVARKRPVLVITQNKKIARLLAKIARAQKVKSSRGKTLYYQRGGRIIITWFRSRVTRGIDIPTVKASVVVGTPYKPPSTLTRNINTLSGELTMLILRFNVLDYRTKAVVPIYITHNPRDLLASISELAQAVGRTVRSVLRSDNDKALVVIPITLDQKIRIYGPLWLVRAL